MSLPEGVALGAELYYTGTSETIVHSKGVVVGPATTEGFVGKGVALRFPDSEQSVDCLLTEVRGATACLAGPTSASRAR